jgi:hypothetical protein
MTKTILLATTALLLSAGAAAAQTPEEAPPQAEAGQTGVLVFEPAFFAEARPNTALDMVERVPGFSVNDGAGTRGFEGSVGNILINGARPASKNDTGSNVLNRTLAANVERIELIRGGAPGIDMQGFSVVVNVILKSTSSREHVVNLNTQLFEGGQDVYGGTYQFTAREGDRTWGVTISDGMGTSDSNGHGRVLRVDANGNVLRDEHYFNDSFGGGWGVRGNYAGPLFGGKIDLTARYGGNDWNQYSLQTAPGVIRDNRYNEDGNSGEFGVVYTRPINDKLSLETRLIHEWNDFESLSTALTTLNNVPGDLQAFGSEGNASESILRGLLRYERSSKWTFEGGAEVAYNMLDTTQAFTIGGVPVPLPSASVKVEEIRGEAFGKALWRMRDDLTLEGGLRLEASTISSPPGRRWRTTSCASASSVRSASSISATSPPPPTSRTRTCSAATSTCRPSRAGSSRRSASGASGATASSASACATTRSPTPSTASRWTAACRRWATSATAPRTNWR